MEAQHILAATHELEESSMTRAQSETIANTIVAAVAPLATTDSLEAAKADIKAVKADIKSMKE